MTWDGTTRTGDTTCAIYVAFDGHVTGCAYPTHWVAEDGTVLYGDTARTTGPSLFFVGTNSVPEGQTVTITINGQSFTSEPVFC